MKTAIVIAALVAAGGLYLYMNNKKSGKNEPEQEPLTDKEKREIDFLVHGGLNYSYEEALKQVLDARKSTLGNVTPWLIN